MTILLSPAKTMGTPAVDPVVFAHATTPRFLPVARELVNTLLHTSPDELQTRLKMSDALTERTMREYRNWSIPGHDTAGVPALAAFTGAVFQALDAATLDHDTWQDAQCGEQRLRILSALYGILRPYDRVLPHRLEADREIYRFWSNQITEELLAEESGEIVNLASQEFSNLLDMERLKNAGRVICTPVFQEFRGGERRVVGTYAKKQRGAMARWILTTRLPSVSDIPNYCLHGYKWNEEFSTPERPVFVR